MRDGVVLEAATRRQRLSDTDLVAAARQQGLRRLGYVDLAVLEADGKISFFTTSGSAGGVPSTAEVG
jgi:uncharacterized membrane protein YcaP (DUF421 family)